MYTLKEISGESPAHVYGFTGEGAKERAKAWAKGFRDFKGRPMYEVRFWKLERKGTGAGALGRVGRAVRSHLAQFGSLNPDKP